jgi:small-conductance mechanosensitive channel
VSVGVQIIYIAAATLAALILYRALKLRINDAIENIHLPAMPHRILDNLARLIPPLIALILIFTVSQILATTTELDLKASLVVMKLLMAWIAIQLFFQFINNSLIRNIASMTIWIITALSIFGILDETHTLLDAAGFNIGKFRLSGLSVVKGMLALFFLLYIASIISSFLEKQVLATKSLSRSLQVLVAKIIHITLITMAILIGITSAGIDLSIFAIFSGAVGLGIGFGLQKVVSNLFSGLLLLTDQSIKPGDVIELEASGTFGWVNNMAARYTEIVTRDNKSYLIPNEEFITQRVVNWSHGNSLVRLEVRFGVHYDSNPHHVIEVATRAAAKPERVVEHPKPVCWITEFSDNSINFSLRFWIRDSENGVTNIKGGVFLALWDAFKEEGIRIPYPHREVYLHEAKDDL